MTIRCNLVARQSSLSEITPKVDDRRKIIVNRKTHKKKPHT